MCDDFNDLLPTPSFSFFCREGLSELYKPLQDSLIKCCVEILELDKNDTKQSSIVSKAWSKLFPKPRRCWLPTGCMVRELFKRFVFGSKCKLLFVIIFLLMYAETSWSFTCSITKNVFDCFRLQFPTWCEGTRWKSSTSFNQGSFFIFHLFIYFSWSC